MAEYEDWIAIFTSGTDYESDLVRDRLDDHGIPAVVLTQRDHAFNLNVSDLATVRVMVPPEYAEEATTLIEEELFTDEELEAAAMAADPDAPDAHSPRDEALLDSGNEQIGGPDEAGDADEDEAEQA